MNKSLVSKALSLSKFFKVEVRITLFGTEILSLEFPPSESVVSSNESLKTD